MIAVRSARKRKLGRVVNDYMNKDSEEVGKILENDDLTEELDPEEEDNNDDISPR